MGKHIDKLRYASIVLLCLVNLGFGLSAAQVPMMLGGYAGLVYVATAVTKGSGPAAVAVELPQA